MNSKEHYRFFLIAITLVTAFGFIVAVRMSAPMEPAYAFPISEERLSSAPQVLSK